MTRTTRTQKLRTHHWNHTKKLWEPVTETMCTQTETENQSLEPHKDTVGTNEWNYTHTETENQSLEPHKETVGTSDWNHTTPQPAVA